MMTDLENALRRARGWPELKPGQWRRDLGTAFGSFGHALILSACSILLLIAAIVSQVPAFIKAMLKLLFLEQMPTWPKIQQPKIPGIENLLSIKGALLAGYLLWMPLNAIVFLCVGSNIGLIFAPDVPAAWAINPVFGALATGIFVLPAWGFLFVGAAQCFKPELAQANIDGISLIV